ncbi:unnamed protein product, partial [Polarella glacialis]
GDEESRLSLQTILPPPPPPLRRPPSLADSGRSLRSSSVPKNPLQFQPTQRSSGAPQSPSPAAAARTSSTAWQQKAEHLQVELAESESEAAKLRLRFSRLEGDVQSKVQRMLHWERLMAAKEEDSASAAAAGHIRGTSCWVSWKSFVERSSVESQKTRRLLSKAPDLAPLELWEGRMRDQLREEGVALECATAELREDEAESAKLSRVVRRSEGCAADERRRQQAVDASNAKIAQEQREAARLNTEEASEARACKLLQQELAEWSRKLLESPAEAAREKLRTVRDQRDEIRRQVLAAEQSAAEQKAAGLESHQDKAAKLEQAAQELSVQLRQAESEASAVCAEHEVEMAKQAHKAAAYLRENIEMERRDQIYREQDELESAQRIQCVVRGVQGRKKAQAVRRRLAQKEQLAAHATERRRALGLPPPTSRAVSEQSQ